MPDQADGLRQLVRARSGAPSRARSLLLTSGKGGVGSSNLALNPAIALGERGGRVVRSKAAGLAALIAEVAQFPLSALRER